MQIKYATITFNIKHKLQLRNKYAPFVSSFQEIMSFCVPCMALVVLVVSEQRSYVITVHSIIYFSGRHNCLWYLIPSSSLKVPLAVQGRFTERSLESLKLDHNSFLFTGGGDLKKAKLFNNVIEEYFFNIPPLKM